MNTLKNKIRLAAGLLAALLAAAVIFSAVFEALHSTHDCTGEGCAVCAVLSVCEQVLASGAAAAAAIMTAASAVYILRAAKKPARTGGHTTLFSLRVMLLN